MVMTTSVSEAGEEAVLAGRMLAVAVRREALGEVEAGRAAGDEIQHAGADDRADHLRDDVGDDVLRRKAPAGAKSDRHRGIEMAAGDVTDRIGHRDDA